MYLPVDMLLAGSLLFIRCDIVISAFGWYLKNWDVNLAFLFDLKV